MSVTSFADLYVEELRDLYSAETQLVEALPKVAEAVSAPALQKAVTSHLEQTKGHVQRLEKIFKDLGEEPGGHTCKAMEGLIEEGKEIIDEIEEGPLRDAAFIGGAQKIEHYEIAGYGTARTFAELIGQKTHLELLQATLDEEGATDHALTKLAMTKVNDKAAVMGEEEAKTGARPDISMERPPLSLAGEAPTRTPSKNRGPNARNQNRTPKAIDCASSIALSAQPEAQFG